MVKVEVLELSNKIGSRPVGSTFLANERDANIWAGLGLIKFEGMPVKKAKPTVKKKSKAKE